ncbi:glycosyltransferase [Sulfobacillus thermosulfidooxidans]|uniref:glycosyltransferase n=1 Tax=Sulfobacillus thermosulfidooxidans TaxID=28034 RepID=UPI0006B4F346|nr:glycosyltransferase [Sulfobacillus thermosulfidooxidans]
MTKPRLLLIGHYPLDTLDRAPKVRIMHMAESLAKISTLTIIAGTRQERAIWFDEALKRGVLDAIDAVYVESASSFATPADIRFLWAVKRKAIPLAIYVRDYYQRFPKLYPPKNYRERVMKWLYVLTLFAYRYLADIIYVPSRALGQLVGGKEIRLLPPGGVLYPVPPLIKPSQQPEPWILYVGAGGPYDGVDLLIKAVHKLHQSMPDVHLALVMRRAEWPKLSPVSYITLVEAHGQGLEYWYARASVAVIPRRDTAYTRLAWPVKLMDYLSHGLGVIVTDQSEAARFVERYQVGQMSQPDSESLAKTLESCLRSPQLLDLYAHNARRVIEQEHSWDHRAQTLVADLLAKKSLGTKRGL